MEKIQNDEQAMDMILSLVSATEPSRDLAISATATIWRLYEKGHTELALAVLGTYNPEVN